MWVIIFQRFVQNSVGVVLLVRGESNNDGVANPFIFSPNELISKLNFSAKYSSTVYQTEKKKEWTCKSYTLYIL